MGTQNDVLFEEIENSEILKVDEKSLKAKEFLNILTSMILSYSQSVGKTA
ncbi:hypothetical protein [Aneurinibacillus terranovensis]|nr:hypothetical protein [Aneurinibacillus terranovensis]